MDGVDSREHRHLRLSELAPELVEVRERSVFPKGGVEYGGKRRKLLMGERLVVVQDEVCERIVDEKRQRLREGAELVVEVKENGGEYWVFDGHHALAAGVLEGGVEQLRLWVRRSGSEAVGQIPYLSCEYGRVIQV